MGWNDVMVKIEYLYVASIGKSLIAIGVSRVVDRDVSSEEGMFDEPYSPKMVIELTDRASLSSP